MSVKFNFIPVASQFVETEEALLKIVGKYFEALHSLGGARITEENNLAKEPLLYLVVTGGTEQLILDIKAKRNENFSNESVFLIAHPTHNSLPASLETLARLQQDGVEGQIFYLNGHEDKQGLNKIIEAINSIQKPKKLENTKIGLVGEPSDWLVASSPSPELVKETWGPEIIKININEVMESINSIKKAEAESMLSSFTKEANKIIEPTNADLENNVKVYLALKALIKKHNLNAITIRCFDLVLDIKTTGCFGLAQLNDEGYIAGCEGDLVSTLGMLWIYKKLNQIPWMANPAQINVEMNTLWLAHCTVPRSLVKNYDLRSHFESGIGVGIKGEFQNGPVTLMRLGGKRIDKIWLAEGEIIQTGNSEHLCRTQIEIKLTDGNVKDLLSSPLGNHIILVNGHHATELK
ncbi:MAG: hypothetical protein OQJ81_02465 [Melioribacteraceae bacterium]|nr:hypothetical protein [Melioribacteraceae bacterium]